MKSPAQEAYEAIKPKLLRAPGMIEEIECRLLFKAAFNCRALPVVEFGAFFGASTLALASGLEARRLNKHPLLSIDAFEVDKDHFFHKHVINYAKLCGSEHLLRESGDKLNWMRVTESVLGDKIKNVKLIKGMVNNDFNMNILPEKIGVLHLDLPKDINTILPIHKGVFPRLIKGSILIFQDYAYQHSNELISLFELLEARGIIQRNAIAASTMIYQITKDDLNSINIRELADTSIEQQVELCDTAIKDYKKIKNYRDSEIIALRGAAIKSIIAQDNKSDFKRQQQILNHIESMAKLDLGRAAFVLSDLLTQILIPHK